MHGAPQLASRRAIALAVVVIAALGITATALAISSTDVQANEPQVAGDASSDTTALFPTNKQNEPSIAFDPQDPNFMVAASNDEQLQPACRLNPDSGTANDCSFFPNVGTDGVYTSSDSGSSWTNQGLLPGFSDNGGSLVSDGDPTLAYGPAPNGSNSFATARSTHSYANGVRVYYGSLASYASGQAKGNQAPEVLTVSRSDNNGASWSNPVISAKANGYTFNDKDSLAVDSNPNSPFFGRVYVSWTQFRGIPGLAEPVMTVYSDDGGKTWSKPTQLSPAYNNQHMNGRQGTSLAVGPDGTVYDVWEDSDKLGSRQVVAVSTNGGASWSAPKLIAHFTDIQGPIPGASFRTDSFATAAVNPVNGNLFVAWSQLVSGSGRIVVYASSNKGASWTQAYLAPSSPGYEFFQGLGVASNGRVDLGFQALTAVDSSTYGTGNASIDAWYVENFGSPVKVSSVSSDPAASAQNDLTLQFWGDYNTLVSAPLRAWFIYTDSRNGVGCPAVDAYQHSVDGTGPSAPKPAPATDCPGSGGKQFGNTDVFVSKIAP